MRLRSLDRRWLIALASAALLAACGAPTAPPKATVERPDPAPLTVAATFDTSLAQTLTLPADGGTIAATGADGTQYLLTVPSGALLEATEVTMTPLSSLVGAPVEGRAHGVLLEPSGLRLYREAALEITPTHASSFAAIGFAAAADGSDFHLVPPVLDGHAASVSFHLMGFSHHGAFTGSAAAPLVVTTAPSAFAPAAWRAQLQHMLADLFAAEREAQRNGEPGDPELESKVEAILNTFFVDVVAPLLPGIAADCAFAEAHLHEALGWTRSVILFGLEATFAREIASAMDAVRAGAHRCWEEAIAPCVDPASTRYARVLQMARTNLLLDGSDAVYDPARADLQCDGTCAWLSETEALHVTVGFDWRASGGPDADGGTGTVDRSWQASGVLTKIEDFETRLSFYARSYLGDAVDASFDVDDVYTYSDGSTSATMGSGAAKDVGLLVKFDTAACTYEGSFWLNARVVTTSIEQTTDHNLSVGSISLLDLAATPSGMERSVALPHRNAVGDGASHFSNGGVKGSAPVRFAEGTADVSWTITPVGAP